MSKQEYWKIFNELIRAGFDEPMAKHALNYLELNEYKTKGE